MRNPWGRVPLTAGGRSLPPRAEAYVERLRAQGRAPDPQSRRHHYVPLSYLREWSFDGKRIRTLDTVTGTVEPRGLRSVCVEEDFHRVAGPGGDPHNRVESLFGVVDSEMRRVQRLFAELEYPGDLEYEDLIGLSVSVAVQRMRTAQQRRLLLQRMAWIDAQQARPEEADDSARGGPLHVAGVHTQTMFEAMWDAADVLSTRQIEVWDDPQERFFTCDAPVVVPFRRNVRPSLNDSAYVLWPISPRRVVALNNELVGEKVVMLTATGKQVGLVRDGVLEGRERMIFASEAQRERLPTGKLFRRRSQVEVTCSDRDPVGRRIDPPGCCVRIGECFATGPVVNLCANGLHSGAPGMARHA